jgi:hypothetical protein
MITPTFKVEGMHYDTEDQALVVAKRLWERYDGARTITIYTVDHHGEEAVCMTLDAISKTEEDEEQLDMF